MLFETREFFDPLFEIAFQKTVIDPEESEDDDDIDGDEEIRCEFYH